MAQLAPFNPPIGIFSQYIAPYPVTLVMKEKVFSLSGDTFNIKDTNGNEVLRCQGQVFSISDRKEFTDTANRPLFTLRSKILSLLRTFNGETPDGKHLFQVKGKFSFGGAKLVATFVNAADGAPIELLVKGSFFERSATITLNGREVAQITRDFLNARQLLGGSQTYYVTVAPGVDLALIAAFCVCLDEKANEK